MTLLFGAERVVEQLDGLPRIAFLGPLVNYEETRDLIGALRSRHPDIGIVVVREQRSDLEDWVDELHLHAVLSPSATDQTTLDLVDRLMLWLVANGKAAADDFAVPDELIAPDDALESVYSTEARESAESTRLTGSRDLDRLFETVEEPMGGGGDADPAPTDVGDPPETVDADASPTDSPVEHEWDYPPLESGSPTEAIAVVAPKGGQGKTTLAINLAVGLAEVAPNSVVLVDGDLQFGDISAALALAPERTVVDAIGAVDDELVLKTTLTHHEAGFFVIASAPSPEYAEQVSPTAFARLIDRLRELFRYIVIDTTPGLGEHTLVALEHVTDAVFVTNMGVPALRALRTEFDLLSSIGLMPVNRHIVLNMSDRLSGLTPRDVERIIGAPLDIEIPRSSAVLLAANRGVPLIHDDVRDPAAKAVRSLVLRVAPEAHPKRGKILRRAVNP